MKYLLLIITLVLTSCAKQHNQNGSELISILVKQNNEVEDKARIKEIHIAYDKLYKSKKKYIPTLIIHISDVRPTYHWLCGAYLYPKGSYPSIGFVSQLILERILTPSTGKQYDINLFKTTPNFEEWWQKHKHLSIREIKIKFIKLAISKSIDTNFKNHWQEQIKKL